MVSFDEFDDEFDRHECLRRDTQAQRDRARLLCAKARAAIARSVAVLAACGRGRISLAFTFENGRVTSVTVVTGDSD